MFLVIPGPKLGLANLLNLDHFDLSLDPQPLSLLVLLLYRREARQCRHPERPFPLLPKGPNQEARLCRLLGGLLKKLMLVPWQCRDQ